jgi:hypothetical protein
MTEQTPNVDALTAFMVVLTKNGGLDVHTSTMPSVTIERTATLTDIEAASSRLLAEAGRMIMREMLQEETAPSPSERVSEALAKRAQE